MLISVIICTYRRVAAVRSLFHCLTAQELRGFEVLVVDGSGENSPEREAVRELVAEVSSCLDVRMIESAKGLTRQRNLGLAESRGDVIVFLDDDVTFGKEFLRQIRELLESPEMKVVGGMSGFDTLHYGQPVSQRWRLRSKLKIVPELRPGAIDRLGRSIPVSMMQPFHGCKPVDYLYGFCMIYRREAIQGMRFDEDLPTYAGEDREFSYRVGQEWRLMLCGDLLMEHHSAPESRETSVQRTYQAGFGTGRLLRRNALLPADLVEFARVLVGEFFIDVLGLLRSPSKERAQAAFARAGGFLAGWKSMGGGAWVSR